ncbi:MAG: ribosomal protein S18-alanine N-acetyltransferase, partial [Anaerolineae bacterium]|nr:ribosomal protein S18-alanine N-acetyltransferase [Anaerolineae bacterium]
MSAILRYMHLTDIREVVVIDRLSFTPAWSEQSYAYEVSKAPTSHMMVMQSLFDNTSRWRRFIRPFTNSGGKILGYAGMWMIADEAHISTIASHPDERGKGVGEMILASLIQKAVHHQSAYVVLEVRVSNVIAQNLYHKYEFTIVDRRANYYHDNREDAFDMRLDLSEPERIARLKARYYAMLQKLD